MQTTFKTGSRDYDRNWPTASNELDRQIAQLRDTMLRISGAIQVLEELQTINTSRDRADGGSGAAEGK